MFWEKIEKLLNRKVRTTSLMDDEIRGDDELIEMEPLRWHHSIWRGERRFFPFEIENELLFPGEIIIEYVTPEDFFHGFIVKKPSFVAYDGEDSLVLEANEENFFLLAKNIYVSVHDNILANSNVYQFVPHIENISVTIYPQLFPDLEGVKDKRKFVKAEEELLETKKRLLLCVGYRVIEIEERYVVGIEG